MKRLSIIICSYNHAEFLSEAIDSALKVEWPDKEVIVVDDGSTDGSRSIIERYRGATEVVFKPNGGHSSAANEGFAQSSGDIVIFLDCDDMLFPNIGKTLASLWYSGISKVQYEMIVGDAHGQTDGNKCWPVFGKQHTPSWALRRAVASGYYLYSPTTGNAWARDFLLKVFPLPTRGSREYLQWFDYYLSLLAPFCGDVVSLPFPLSMYRLHEGNGSAFRADRCSFELSQLEITVRLATAQLEQWGKPERPRCFNEPYMKRVLAERRLKGEPSIRAMAGYWSTLGRADFDFAKICRAVVWSVIVAGAPRRLALQAINARGNR